MNKSFFVFLNILLITLITSCATTINGPIFTPIDKISKDKAIVYLYWTNELQNNMKKVEYMIEVDGKKTTKMIYGGYYPIISISETDPKEINLSSHVNFKFMVTGILDVALAPTHRLKLILQPGKVYFVHCSFTGAPGFAHTYGLSMKLIPDEKIAYNNISTAKLLPEYKETQTSDKKTNL